MKALFLSAILFPALAAAATATVSGKTALNLMEALDRVQVRAVKKPAGSQYQVGMVHCEHRSYASVPFRCELVDKQASNPELERLFPTFDAARTLTKALMEAGVAVRDVSPWGKHYTAFAISCTRPASVSGLVAYQCTLTK